MQHIIRMPMQNFLEFEWTLTSHASLPREPRGRSFLVVLIVSILGSTFLLWSFRHGKPENTVVKIKGGNALKAVLPTCTARVLLDEEQMNASGTYGWDVSDGIQKWQVSKEAKEVCHLDEPFLVPLQSSPEDIQAALERKWLLVLGDSSVRMLYDYLTGRWLGNYTHWPEVYDNHGPKHPKGCHGPNAECHYDVFHRGARVTFVWISLQFTNELESILENSVGLPDIVVGQHGYWEHHYLKNESLQDRFQVSEENAASIAHHVTEILNRHQMEEHYPQAYKRSVHRVWMSILNPFFKNLDLSFYDGTEVARDLGWDIFNRSKIVNINGNNEGPHPMNEVLEIELELLLQIIRNLP